MHFSVSVQRQGFGYFPKNYCVLMQVEIRHVLKMKQRKPSLNVGMVQAGQ